MIFLLIFSQDCLMIYLDEISNCCLSLPVYSNPPPFYQLWRFLPTYSFITPSPFIILAEIFQPPRLFRLPLLFETREFCSEVYSEHSQTSKMEHFEETVDGFEPLAIFAKCSILDVWQVSDTPPLLTFIPTLERK